MYTLIYTLSLTHTYTYTQKHTHVDTHTLGGVISVLFTDIHTRTHSMRVGNNIYSPSTYIHEGEYTGCCLQMCSECVCARAYFVGNNKCTVSVYVCARICRQTTHTLYICRQQHIPTFIYSHTHSHTQHRHTRTLIGTRFVADILEIVACLLAGT